MRMSRVVRGRIGRGGVEGEDVGGGGGRRIGLFAEAQNAVVLKEQPRMNRRGSQGIRDMHRPQAELGDVRGWVQ